MSNSGIKITALSDITTIPENGETAISVGGNIGQTFGATLTALRSAILFETAYSTVKAGIKGTSDGEIFFVYSDTTQTHVLGYTNVNGTSATILTDDDGNQVRYGTYVNLRDGTSSSTGGGTTDNYVDWVYNEGVAVGGETTITIDSTCLDVKAVWVSGLRQFKSLNFTFDVATQKVTLADTLEGGELVVCEILPTNGSNTVSPDISNYVNVSWVYNSGSANGGESTITPPYSFQTVPAVYLNGARQVLGYQYTVNGTTSIALASPLKKGDFLQVILGGEETQLVVSIDSSLGDLSKDTGSKLIGYRYTDVYTKLSAFARATDYGRAKSLYGYDGSLVGQYLTDRANNGDDDTYLFNGGLMVGRNTYGTGWNSCALSVRSDVDPGNLFNPQLGSLTASVFDVATGSSGGVAMYTDAVSMPFLTGEILNSPVYTDTTVTDDAVSVGVASNLIKTGSIIKTQHDTPWYGVVESISGNTLTLRDGWAAQNATVNSTPTSGKGCVINPKRSFWGHNTNLILSKGGRGSAGYGHEYGIRNDSGNMVGVVGVAILQMPDSTTDSQYGMNVGKTNSTQSTRFDTTYFAGAGRINFFSNGDSGTEYGMQFYGNHQNCLIGSNIGDNNNFISVMDSNGNWTYVVKGSGLLQRQGVSTVNLGSAATGTMTPDYQHYHSNYGASQTITVTPMNGYPLYQVFRKWSGYKTTFVPVTGATFSYLQYQDVTSITITGQTKVEFKLGSGNGIWMLVEAGTVTTLTSTSTGVINF